jgi:hypothetical protein
MCPFGFPVCNPHITYFEATGVATLPPRVTEKQLEVGLRLVTGVEHPNGSGYHERAFVVEGGSRARSAPERDVSCAAAAGQRSELPR